MYEGMILLYWFLCSAIGYSIGLQKGIPGLGFFLPPGVAIIGLFCYAYIGRLDNPVPEPINPFFGLIGPPLGILLLIAWDSKQKQDADAKKELPKVLQPIDVKQEGNNEISVSGHGRAKVWSALDEPKNHNKVWVAALGCALAFVCACVWIVKSRGIAKTIPVLSPQSENTTGASGSILPVDQPSSTIGASNTRSKPDATNDAAYWAEQTKKFQVPSRRSPESSRKAVDFSHE